MHCFTGVDLILGYQPVTSRIIIHGATEAATLAGEKKCVPMTREGSLLAKGSTGSTDQTFWSGKQVTMID